MSCCIERLTERSFRLGFLLPLVALLLGVSGCGRDDSSSGKTASGASNANGSTTVVSSSRNSGKGGANTLPLFFTSNTHGKLTHCGCFSGQFGGVARLRSAVEGNAYKDYLGVDVGDALEGPEDYHLLKYKQVVAAYSEMGYAAMNAGHREAMLSIAELRKIGAASTVPLISANVLDRATKRPVLPGWTIVKRDGRRIAFVGVVDPRGLDETLGDGLEVEDMATCLARVLPEVKKSADVLVLLAFTDEASLSTLARQFYEFSLILGGKVSQPAQALQREGQTYVYYTANEAKSYGTLTLDFAKEGKASVGEHAITLLTPAYMEHEEVLALLAKYQREVSTTKLAVDSIDHARAGQVPGIRVTASYVGTPACVACHPSAAAAWEQSGHSRAFAMLEAKGASTDPSCIGCHTVGFGMPTGYRREFGAAKLTNVGCESCHGPGSLHVAQRQAGGLITAHFRPLGAGDCMTCHRGEFSRPFEWQKFWPHIEHGKEPTSK